MRGAGGIAGNVHRQVEDARRASRIGEGVMAIAIIVDAVACVQLIGMAIESEQERTLLDRYIFARTGCVWQEDASVDIRSECRPHQFKFNPRQHRRKDPPLPTRWIAGDCMFLMWEKGEEHRS